jgi:phosphoenolpyruvate synthase/pyruvate phosphate dikinase
MDVASKLEAMNRDMQDIEFTVQDGKLFILQTRDAKRTSQAAVAVALDFWNAGLINAEEMIFRVKADDILKASRPGIDPAWLKDNPAHAKGLPASPGVVYGKAVFSAAQAVILATPLPTGCSWLTPLDRRIVRSVNCAWAGSPSVTAAMPAAMRLRRNFMLIS